MPVRVRIVLSLMVIGLVLTACTQPQMQQLSTAVSQPASPVGPTSAGPTFAALVEGQTSVPTTANTEVAVAVTIAPGGATATRTPRPSRTPRPTLTPTNTRTPTKVVTKKPTNTPGPTNTPTNTPDVTPTITGTPLPTLNKDVMGIQAYGNVGDKDWAQFMDRAGFMGFGWLKFQLSWKELEPAKGQYTQQMDVIKK